MKKQETPNRQDTKEFGKIIDINAKTEESPKKEPLTLSLIHI